MNYMTEKLPSCLYCTLLSFVWRMLTTIPMVHLLWFFVICSAFGKTIKHSSQIQGLYSTKSSGETLQKGRRTFAFEKNCIFSGVCWQKYESWSSQLIFFFYFFFIFNNFLNKLDIFNWFVFNILILITARLSDKNKINNIK